MTIKTPNYADLTKETARLLNIEKGFFEYMLTVFDIFGNDSQEENSNNAYFLKNIPNIENEIQKLEKMEIVIAVVGTMKAGKSTTINAIVGTEVLPNRNAPMTTLPTLIRNKHGQTEPVLKLNKLEPLKNLSQEIAKTLAKLEPSQLEKLDLYNSPDGKELVNILLKNKGYPFKNEYKSQQAIFPFLKHLNDLMRLAKGESVTKKDADGKEIKEPALFDYCEPPFNEYENIDDLPVIEIEFHHLKGKADMAQGSLAILDTPGPNEFGQSEKLKNVFKTQLQKASAVGLVIDYTQMNAEAGATILEQIEHIREQLPKENLYVLVNKFDQSNTNSMDKEQVQDYVIKTLMKGTIEANQVYPISSQNAYLANRATHTIELNKTLPNFEVEGWVADFGKIALGTRWLKKIDDIEEVIDCAKDLWEESNFNELSEGMVKKAHSTAAENCVKTAVSKLTQYHQELTNTCTVINHSLVAEISKITDAIQALENSINDIEDVKKNVDKIAKNNIDRLKNFLEERQNETQKQIKEEINSFFEKGKIRAKKSSMSEEHNKKIKEIQDAIVEERYQKFFVLLNKQENNQRQRKIIELEYQLMQLRENVELEKLYQFAANNPILSFSEYERDKAEELLKNIEKEITVIINTLTNDSAEEVNKITTAMSKQVTFEINSKTTDLLNKAKEKLGEFQLNLSFPQLELSFDLNTSTLTSEGLKANSKSYSYYEVRGFFNTIFNFFDEKIGKRRGWGDVKVTKNTTTYDIDTNKIREMIFSELEQYEKNHTEKFTDYLGQDVRTNVNNHINELSIYLERYRDLFLSSEKANAEMEQEKKKQIIEKLEVLTSKNKTQFHDINVLKQSLGFQA